MGGKRSRISKDDLEKILREEIANEKKLSLWQLKKDDSFAVQKKYRQISSTLAYKYESLVSLIKSAVFCLAGGIAASDMGFDLFVKNNTYLYVCFWSFFNPVVFNSQQVSSWQHCMSKFLHISNDVQIWVGFYLQADLHGKLWMKGLKQY